MSDRKSSRSDGQRTRMKIIEVAGRLFAENGFTATSNKQIVAIAKVDLASINYHFGGREGLYAAVIEEAHKHYFDLEELKTLDDSNLPPSEKFHLFISILISHVRNNIDWHSSLFLKELVAPSPQLLKFINQQGDEKLQIVQKIISELSGLEPHSNELNFCIFNIIATCFFLLASRNTSSKITHSLSQIDQETLVNHFYIFFTSGINAIKKQSVEI